MWPGVQGVLFHGRMVRRAARLRDHGIHSPAVVDDGVDGADGTLSRMGVRKRLAVTIGSIEWMPRYLPQIVKCDSAIQKVTGQRYSLLDIADLPNITLDVPGRKVASCGAPGCCPPRTVPID